MVNHTCPYAHHSTYKDVCKNDNWSWHARLYNPPAAQSRWVMADDETGIFDVVMYP